MDGENIYDEIEIEDMTYDVDREIYHYPCPCGDRFEIAVADLRDGEDVAVCPSCSLMIRVVYDLVSLRAVLERSLEAEGFKRRRGRNSILGMCANLVVDVGGLAQGQGG